MIFLTQMPKIWVLSLSFSFFLEFWVFFALSFFSNGQKKACFKKQTYQSLENSSIVSLSLKCWNHKIFIHLVNRLIYYFELMPIILFIELKYLRYKNTIRCVKVYCHKSSRSSLASSTSTSQVWSPKYFHCIHNQP